MTKIENWAATIAAVFVTVIVIAVAPIIYPMFEKLVNSSYITNYNSVLTEVNEKIIPLKYAGDIEEIEESLYTPEGIFLIRSSRANIRSTPEVVDDNVIGETYADQYLLYYDTTQVGDITWYLIEQRENLENGWISGLTGDVVSTSSDTVENPELVMEFMEEYSNATIKSIENYDFSIVEPYLLSNSEIYNEQKDYLSYLEEEQISEEILAFKVVNSLNVGENQIWVRTIELYDISYGDESKVRKDFVSEYLLKFTEDGYKLQLLIGLYE